MKILIPNFGCCKVSLSVFIRENKNRSGSVSIQVVQKVRGKNKVVFTAGSGNTKHEIELLKLKAQEFIDQRQGSIPLFIVESLSNDNLRIAGPQMVLGPIYDMIFPNITQNYLKDLVLCRNIYPGSKLRTVAYLSRHFNITVSEQLSTGLWTGWMMG